MSINSIKSGMSFTGKVSVEVSSNDLPQEGKINITISLFSMDSQWSSVKFQYKRDILDEWRDDAVIIASSAKFVDGNNLYGLQCSKNGFNNSLVWDFEANGLSFGSKSIVRAVIIPSLSVLCSAGNFSWIETIFQDGNRIVSDSIFGKAVGIDGVGNIIVFQDKLIKLIDITTQETIMSFDGLDHPTCATGSPNGLIVADKSGIIVELDLLGNIVKTFNAAIIANGEFCVFYDPVSGNLLLTGGDIPMAYEMAWDVSDYGTVLWSYGGISLLNNPKGISYDELKNIVVCDTDNNRLVVIDRTSYPQSISYIDSITVELISGVVSVPLYRPIQCVTSGGNFYVYEAAGKTTAFGETPATHPAMLRDSLASNEDGIIPQYKGMLYTPIIRSIK